MARQEKKKKPKTHDTEPPLHILITEILSLLIDQIERPTDFRSPHPLSLFRHALPVQPFLLPPEVEDQTCASNEEYDRRRGAEGTGPTAGARFLDGAEGAVVRRCCKGSERVGRGEGEAEEGSEGLGRRVKETRGDIMVGAS